MINTTAETVYIKMYGRLYKVMAVCDSVESANDFMNKNRAASLIQAEQDLTGWRIYLADENDIGIEFPA
jgi:hypothetical protein